MDKYKLGMLVGLMIGFVVVFILLKIMTKDNAVDRRYDERQEFMRGKAFKWAFFGMIGYNMIFTFAAELIDQFPVKSSLMAMGGVIFGIAIFATISIMNDAYIALNEKINTIFIVFPILGIMNLIIGISNIASGDAIEDGCLSFRNTNLLCAALFLEIIIVLLYKLSKDKKED